MAISILNRLPRLPGSHTLTPLLLGALFLGAGAVVGLVVATGNLILIALVLGAIGGLLLLNALPIAVWLVLGGVFLINGPVGYFWPGMAKVSWLFSLLGIFMAGAALLYSVSGVKRYTRPMPAFIYTSLAFIVLAVISGLISDGGVGEVAAGAKRYFQFWGVMFLLAVVPFTQKQVRNWMLFLVGIALVQLPFTLYQRFVLVPTVLGYDKPGFVPFDIIVGTFEGSITGGGASSIMAMFQVLMVFAIFCAWREKLINGFWTLLLVAVMLLPLGLGETKVVLVLLPVVLFSAYFDLVAKRPLAFIGIVIATLFFGAILGYFYFVVQTSGDIADMSLGENLRDTLEYNFGKRGYYATGVNRLTAVPYWFESQSWNNPIKTLFGTGIGSSYGIDGLVPDPGHMFRAHPGMHIDLLTTSTVLWDFGIVGFILYFLIILGAMRTVARCFNEATTSFDRVLCRLLMSSLAVTLVMAAYTNSAVVLVSHGFIVSLTLGLVAWRYRHGPLSPTAADLKRAARPRFSPRFGGGGTKVIFPTEGVMSPAMLGAWREQRLLGHGAAGVADEVPAADATTPPPVSGAEAPAVEATGGANPFAATAAAGQSARSAFPKAGAGGMPAADEQAVSSRPEMAEPSLGAASAPEASVMGADVPVVPGTVVNGLDAANHEHWQPTVEASPSATEASVASMSPDNRSSVQAPVQAAGPVSPTGRTAVPPAAETGAAAERPPAGEADAFVSREDAAVSRDAATAVPPPAGATAAVPDALAGGSRPAFGSEAQIRPAGGRRLAPEFFPPGKMPHPVEEPAKPAEGAVVAEQPASQRPPVMPQQGQRVPPQTQPLEAQRLQFPSQPQPEQGQQAPGRPQWPQQRQGTPVPSQPRAQQGQQVSPQPLDEQPRSAFPKGGGLRARPASPQGGLQTPPRAPGVSNPASQQRGVPGGGPGGGAGRLSQAGQAPAARSAFPDDGRWQPPSGSLGGGRAVPGRGTSGSSPFQSPQQPPARQMPGRSAVHGAPSMARQGQSRPAGLGAGMPRRPQRQEPREPVIDINGPETRPMFADDDDPHNRVEPRSSSWNDPRGRPRRR